MGCMDVASIGPLEPDVRDKVAEYRDREGHPNYNEAVQDLLRQADNGGERRR